MKGQLMCNLHVGRCKQVWALTGGSSGFQSMRGLCKEEDYAFLGVSEKMPEDEKQEDKAAAFGNDWRIKREERVRDKDK